MPTRRAHGAFPLPAPGNDVVFLLDVDNTLLDNDRFAADLGARLEQAFGAAERDRYWTIYAALWDELAYADYLGTLQRFRAGLEDDPRLLEMSAYLLEYPFEERLYPHALETIAHLGTMGTPAVLSDGDVVFQPRKIQRSGIWDAVEGRVLIYPHKERRLKAVQRRCPAAHYVMVGDKPRLLAAMKRSLGEKLTTVFVRQGQYAAESAGRAVDPPPDLSLDHVGDLLDCARARFLTVKPARLAPSEEIMNRTSQLHDLGQSLWLDDITREDLDDGTLQRYIDEFSITGLTSNPTIFDRAIGSTAAYDEGIRDKAGRGKSGETLFLELALEDLRRAADLFRPVFDATDGVDGWVSMEVSPWLARDTPGTIEAAARIRRQADRPNLFVKIPGTPEGIPAIEQSIFDGVPINVTLLFSPEQYLAAAEAYLRGVERRLASGLDPRVASVASLFVSRWDRAVAGDGPPELRNRLGIAIAARTYHACRALFASPRWRKLAEAGARTQRLLWASTGTKDPAASDTLYVEALAAPDTINTMPAKTLRAFAEHGTLGGGTAFGSDADRVRARFVEAGIDLEALSLRLQRDGVRAFEESWNALLERIAEKSVAVVEA